MVSVPTRLGIEVGQIDDRTLESAIKTLAAQRAQIFKIKAIAERAVDKAVDDNQFDFIPFDEEIGELGIGDGGSVDTEKTEGAWKLLQPSTPGSFTTVNVKRVATSRGDIPGAPISIGVIEVQTKIKSFLKHPLCNVPTPDSEHIDNIPWMKWLIFGAPANSDFRFESRVLPNTNSRTGEGIMVRGGLWTFPPARPNAFQNLRDGIFLQLLRTFERENVGDVLFV